MRKTVIRKSLKIILPLLLAAFLFRMAFKDQDLDQVWVALKAANYNWVFLSLAFSLLSHVVRAIRWKMLIEPSGYNLSVLNSFYAVMAGYLANLALPRMGEVSRCGMLNRKTKIPVNVLIGTVIVERAIDVICLLGLTLGVFLLNYEMVDSIVATLDLPKKKIPHLDFYWILGILGVVSFFLYGTFKFLLRFYKAKRFWVKLKSFFEGVFGGVKSIRKMKNPYLFVFYTVLMWFLYFLVFYVCCFAVEATSKITPFDGLLGMIMGSYGIAAPVQGGVGAFHALVALTFSMLPNQTISYNEGLVFATIIHGVQMVMIIVFGAIGTFLLLVKSKNKYGIFKQTKSENSI